MATPSYRRRPSSSHDGRAGEGGSPWASLLKDNLNAQDVAGFLNSAIARREAALLSERETPAPSSPVRASSSKVAGTSTHDSSSRLSRAPSSVERQPTGDRRHSAARSHWASLRHGLGTMRSELEAFELVSHASSRPGSPPAVEPPPALYAPTASPARRNSLWQGGSGEVADRT